MSRKVKMALSLAFALPFITVDIESVRADSPPAPVDSSAAASDRFTPTLDLRVRYELGDLSGSAKSNATTARARIGLKSPTLSGFAAFAEIEATQALDRTSYQAASVHGLGRGLTIIADPESTEVNRLSVSWENASTRIEVGRQRIILDGARFVGNVGWRQNEQTYDAALLRNTSLDHVTLTYAYVANVNRIFGSSNHGLKSQDDFDSSTHLFNVVYTGLPKTKVAGYAYFIDLDNSAGDNASNDTFGLSVSGKMAVSADVELGYHGEYAYQTDAASSLLNYRSDYFHAQTWGAYGSKKLGIGYEVLGGGDGVGFQTPLATLHKYNGWGDVFLATPSAGLIDRYAWVGFTLPFGIKAKAIHHDFTAEDSRRDFGREYDVLLVKSLPRNLKATAKYAVFTSESPSYRDLRRITVQLEYKY